MNAVSYSPTRKFMGSGQLVKCICNQTHGGDVCSHCGLPHSTARYLSQTGPLLPFFILAGMAAVFCFNHYNIADRLNRQIEEPEEFIPIIFDPATPLSSEPKPKVEPKVEPKALTPELLEKKAYHMLHLLVGRYPEGESISTMFSEEILNMSLDIKTSRDDILESMNGFLARFPVRVVRLTSVGRKDRMLEINTRRIFLDADGARLDVYGKTVVMLDAEGQITGLSDDIQDTPAELSKGFTPIEYSRQKTISNNQ